MTLDVGGLLLANTLLAALGGGMLLLLDTWRRLTWWTRPAVALVAGQAAFVVVAPWLLYTRLSVSPVVVVPLIAVVLASGIATGRRRSRPADARAGGQGWITAALAGIPLLALAVRAALHPLFQFDTLSNWVTKAVVLWAGGDRLTGVLDPRFFTRPDLHPQSHLEYPLGLNALYAWDIHWMGGLDGRVLHLQLVLVLAGAIGCAWVLLRPIVPAVPLAAGLAGLAIMPTVVDGLLSAYADVPLACLWAVGTIALLRWKDEDERYLLALATLLLAAVLALKQDGAFYTLASYGSVALAARRRLRPLAVSAATVAVSAVPWRIYTHVYGLSDTDIRPSPNRMGDQTGNVRPTIDGIWHVLTGRPTLLAVPIAAAFALACLLRGRQTGAGPFLLISCLVPGALTLVYWNATVNLPLVLIPALSRVLAGLVVLAWLLLPLFVYEALSGKPALAPTDPLP